MGRAERPRWTFPLVISMAGMRGAISLAAALAVPEVLATTGYPRLPDRPLVIYLTFCVILVTLVGQGLLLPTLIRRLGLAEQGEAERADRTRQSWDARIGLAEAALHRLDELAAGEKFPPGVIAAMRRRHEARVRHLSHHRAEDDARGEQADAVERRLLSAARRQLYRLRRRGDVDDGVSRQIEHELDLEQTRLGQGEV